MRTQTTNSASPTATASPALPPDPVGSVSFREVIGLFNAEELLAAFYLADVDTLPVTEGFTEQAAVELAWSAVAKHGLTRILTFAADCMRYDHDPATGQDFFPDLDRFGRAEELGIVCLRLGNRPSPELGSDGYTVVYETLPEADIEAAQAAAAVKSEAELEREAAPQPGEPGFDEWVLAAAERMRQGDIDAADLGSFTPAPGEDGQATAHAMLRPFLEA